MYYVILVFSCIPIKMCLSGAPPNNNPGCLKHQSGFFCAYKIANISPTEFIANLFRLLKVYDVLLHIFYDFIALHLASLILRAGTRLPIVSEIKK